MGKRLEDGSEPLLKEGEKEESTLKELEEGMVKSGGDDTVSGGGKGDSRDTHVYRVSYRRLFQLAKPELLVLCFAVVALFVSAVANLALPTFAGDVIDAVTRHPDTPEGKAATYVKVNQKLVQIVAVVIVGSIATSMRVYLFTSASERVVARLKRDLFGSLVRQEVAFFDVTRTGELMSRLSEDTQIIKNAVTLNLSELLRGISTALLGLSYMFVKSWRLTCLTLVIVPAVAIGIRQYGKYLKELSRKTQAASAAAAAVAEECIGAIRTVRAFAQEGSESERYREKVEVSLTLGLHQACVGGLFSGGMFAAATLSLVAVMWYGAHLAVSGGMSPGSLASFIIYALTVGFSVASLAGIYATVMKALGAGERVFHLLDREPSMVKAGSKRPMGDEAGGEVRLQKVWFAYPSRPSRWVLKGVNLTLLPGSKLALVGPSGGGKSTIANLVERFYDPQTGVITLDGCPLPEISHDYLHRQISIVSQEPVLFNTTIAENIAYGSEPSASSATAIQLAATMANAHEFISQFPEGYENLVGERGVRLSGGQKQRIAIARALLMSPRVLLLDEATSALDAESEYLVQDAMDRLMVGRTTLVIAHRLSTVQSAHVVAVVDKGVIVERGSHAELLERNGIYAGLVRRQLQGGTGLGGTAQNANGGATLGEVLETHSAEFGVHCITEEVPVNNEVDDLS
ncbi:hypothetical protein CBR_g23255 [Chara braunii]|uniref:Uncharacterized protein n=1 Tax=Chara braunii TaxID=69332 RepID=A0A388JVD7_CHABU|nr:hypothetical protein CBR_g23255 [Chara braunii]|eukprot:GBG61740.1 hypothetical protein CBR_g23255 [Chara braunii]